MGEDIILPKVSSGLICIVSVKCPQRREDEVLEDEIGMDGIEFFFSYSYSKFNENKKIHLSRPRDWQNYLSVKTNFKRPFANSRQMLSLCQ